ncbi:MAG: dTMP kinase [Paraglaciecola sp.]|jgi:dTMP kinase
MSKLNARRGKFIVIEGVDGSGKTTQIDRLQARFKENGWKFHDTAEPTDGPIGSLVRNILNKRIVADERTIAALYLADRLDHIQNDTNGMLKHLNEGTHVIASRYYFSSFAYQATKNVSLDWLIDAHELVRELLKPDLNIFVDISPEESMRRLTAGRSFLDLFETEEKITAVRKGYWNAFDKIGKEENLAVIDGMQSETEIAKEIWRKVIQII